ncbi:MAG: zinc ribbon domain-containing protein [Candidatus Rokubacteria bacterium]|nr:zinc ribbon domain-containing protein [Candidatus Rokubacteria bacterium]
MPIYEYRCRTCGGDFEKYVAMSGAAVACPSCASESVMRKLSVFGVRADTPVASAHPTGASAHPTGASAHPAMSGGGGCCGGGCSCG